MANKIEAVILLCSLDERFFSKCINNLLSAGIKCNVITYTNLFAGEPENEKLISDLLSEFKSNVNFKHSKIEWMEGYSSLYWEAWGRYIGINMTDKDCGNILFIDSDEIIELGKFKRWLQLGFHNSYKAIKLPQYTYALEPEYRLNVKAYNTILCKADYVKNLSFKVDARLQYFNNDNLISRWLAKLGLNPYFFIYKGTPFIHHYTGVRTKEQMLKKVDNWSHNSDRNDWRDVVEKTYGIHNGKIGSHTFKIIKDNILKK